MSLLGIDFASLSEQARRAGRQYDIDAFVRKMERLYTVLHRLPHSRWRRNTLGADLSFLTSAQPTALAADRTAS